jgi:erythrin-vacuolar iron transport family protein
VSGPRSGECLHTSPSPFPFLIPNLTMALNLAYMVVACEPVAIAFIRYRFMGGKLINTIVQVVIGGALVFGIGVFLGRIGAS